MSPLEKIATENEDLRKALHKEEHAREQAQRELALLKSEHDDLKRERDHHFTKQLMLTERLKEIEKLARKEVKPCPEAR